MCMVFVNNALMCCAAAAPEHVVAAAAASATATEPTHPFQLELQLKMQCTLLRSPTYSSSPLDSKHKQACCTHLSKTTVCVCNMRFGAHTELVKLLQLLGEGDQHFIFFTMLGGQGNHTETAKLISARRNLCFNKLFICAAK